MKPSQLPVYFSYGNVKFKLNSNGTATTSTFRSRPKTQQNDKEIEFAGKIISDKVDETINLYNKEVSFKMDETYSELVNPGRAKSKDRQDKPQDSPEQSFRITSSKSSKIEKFIERVTDANENSLKKHKTYIDPSLRDRSLEFRGPAPDSPGDGKIRELYLDRVEQATQCAEAFPLNSSTSRSPRKSRNSSPVEKKPSQSMKRAGSSPRLSLYSTPPKKPVSKKAIEYSSDSKAVTNRAIMKHKISQEPIKGKLKTEFESLSVSKFKGQPLSFKPHARPTQVYEELKTIISNKSLFNFLIEFEISSQAWVDELASEFQKQVKTELEKAFISYLWICMNIEVETQETKVPSFGNSSNDIVRNVLENRRANSKGFALCFEYLCREMGISADVIKGFTKPGSLDQAFQLEITQHHWNIVKLSGNYYLVDCTLGAGYLEEEKFFPRLELGYFLAKPEYFIFRHFPEFSENQLIEPPMLREEFNRAVFVGDGFYKCKLLPSFPIDSLFEAKDGLVFEFLCAKEICVIATVEDSGKKVPNSVITTRKGNKATIDIVFRKQGYYTIELFVKNPEAKKFSTALRYLVDAKISDLSKAQSMMSVPKIYGFYYDLSISLVEPILNSFKNGDAVTFRIGSNRKDLESVACVEGAKEKWYFFTQKRSHKIWEVTLKSVERPIHLAIKLKGSKTFKDILSYE